MLVHKLKMELIFIVTLMCFLAPVQQAHIPGATISDLSFKNMDFAMNLYRKISSYHDKNIFFSPLSISTSFAALLMASDGVTHQEILKGLNLEQLERADQPQLIPTLFKLLHENITQNGSLKLDQGMALFTHQQFLVEKAFEDQIKTFFDADIKRVNFADTTESINFINEYIKQKTQNKVTDMISSLDAQTQVMLIDTIFFQGGWQKTFNSNHTTNAPFYIDNYNIVQVPMMFLEDKFYTMEDAPLGARVLKLPYLEGVSMLILLPNKGIDYTEIDDGITAERFLSWIKKLQKINSANLTKLSNQYGLKVSEVLHKAVIKVDETGTTAAAATTSGIIPYSLPRTFTINRPFFFFIYHEDTNCLLFMGRVIDPTKN
ncbi:Protein Z-dependent protease inhibitor [Dissostichus eleginoides]|uniref:Protein Z-dependent protease inhibitor n=1 Tax=Dissostichus eleginoides TaxID=100907 RepID=A0AAD9FCK4_DISEL|nr:Protein Z-dependent protease inhibitor [Dissostichus eleginoides]